MTLVTQNERLDVPNVPGGGLTTAQVNERIARGDTNAFEARVGRSYGEIFRYNIFNTFNLVLFLLLGIVIFLRDFNTVVFAGFSVVMNSLIGTIQEIDAKRKLTQLADLASNEVMVWRNGERLAIDNHAVVQDDLIIIQPGDLLTVDGTVVESDSLEIDESQLTGESDAIYKQPGEPITSGSYCIAGSGTMVATQVGRHSTVNKLAATARRYKRTVTPTERRITTIVQFTLMVMAIFLPTLIVAGYNKDETFLEITRSAIVFVTSLVPQGLILIVILSLTIGAVKISRHQTLVQRVNAVESLANVTVLCFDKTGTLTENRLVVKDIIPQNGLTTTEIENQLYCYLSTISHQNSTAVAVAEYLTYHDVHKSIPTKTQEIPFTSARKWGAVRVEDDVMVLGAPERVFGPSYDEIVKLYGKEGLRVLAFGALKSLPDPKTMRIVAQPIALITIRDRVRDDSQAMLAAFIEQGVRPVVISGDNLQTVVTVAKMSGMRTDIAVSGDDLKAMSDSEFDDAVCNADVFARIEPDTKRRIIASLQRQGEYVAMVGDGVNDVPALKQADLAVTMNDGAQISKDIADIVLLNNAMSTLPLAFREGTEITQTLYGTTKMFLTKNLYNTLVFILTAVMALPFPITPIQISWQSFGTTNMTGGLMALGILRPDLIKNFRRDVLDYIIIGGVTGAAGLAILYLVLFNYAGQETARHAMTIAFTLYSLMILYNIAGIDFMQPRTIRKSPMTVVVSLVLVAVTLSAALTFPETFEFRMPPGEVLLLVFLMHALLTALVSVALRKRGLLHRFYDLTRNE